MSPRSFILAALLGCGHPGAGSPDTPAADTPAADTRSSDAGLTTLDCVANDPACPELAIMGDSPSGEAFTGFADPTIRRDGARLWLAYSSAHTTPADVIDVRLAHSDDEGATWQFDTVLWPTVQVTNPITNTANYTSSEVANLATDGAGTWYGIRATYLVDPAKAQYAQPGTSGMTITTASSPSGLATAPSALLGSTLTNAKMNPAVDLHALSPALAHCDLFNEPALIVRGGTLYLLAQCLSYNGLTYDPSSDFYAVFATQPSGAPATWTWRYAGAFGTHADAEALDGHTYWVQLDIATALDGTLLAIVTPSEFDTADVVDIHFGCRAIELAALDPPVLARDATGAPVLRASVTASDLAQPDGYGPGACSYDPSSTTGILLVRRTGLVIGESIGVFTLHRTGVLAP